ncbi:hypothetical protein FJR48_00365 [Sulfurimonas lithotrophica]|uniref:Type II toxin-antitoxin system RelE/ParE family toxin n=1 Tax=Sulfurimonas lithotrophica TaxID=2590022 RepID=A0A5P8NXW9_9BACT|nr:type II toxin-antitoxin system RelE/ParE family toxin [Sulfurimonas lithotrophica]QFR48256.1 hypothetical protein FJR48_00365 [Sulfurimonas lithotrophica]
MKILCTETFEKQLKHILKPMANQNFEDTKKFKTYLDTILINIPTKAAKYKKSVYYDNENVKDVEYEQYTIVFYIDELNNSYVILGIFDKNN